MQRRRKPDRWRVEGEAAPSACELSAPFAGGFTDIVATRRAGPKMALAAAAWDWSVVVELGAVVGAGVAAISGAGAAATAGPSLYLHLRNAVNLTLRIRELILRVRRSAPATTGAAAE